jgi:DNA replicative helicase MCM subunit Mcm2 (Cdc46/Mcm family)
MSCRIQEIPRKMNTLHKLNGWVTKVSKPQNKTKQNCYSMFSNCQGHYLRHQQGYKYVRATSTPCKCPWGGSLIPLLIA